MSSQIVSYQLKNRKPIHFELLTDKATSKSASIELQKRLISTYASKFIKKRKAEGKKIDAFRKIQIESGRTVRFLKGKKVLFETKISKKEIVKKASNVVFHKKESLFQGTNFKNLAAKKGLLTPFLKLFAWVQTAIKGFFLGKGPSLHNQLLFEEALNLSTRLPSQKDMYNLNAADRVEFLLKTVKNCGKKLDHFPEIKDEIEKGKTHFKKLCSFNGLFTVQQAINRKKIEKHFDQIKRIKRLINSQEGEVSRWRSQGAHNRPRRNNPEHQLAVTRVKLRKLIKEIQDLEKKEADFLKGRAELTQKVLDQVSELSEGKGVLVPLQMGNFSEDLQLARVVKTGKSFTLQILGSAAGNNQIMDDHKVKCPGMRTFKKVTAEEIENLFKANDSQYQIFQENERKEFNLSPKKIRENAYQKAMKALTKKLELPKAGKTPFQSFAPFSSPTKALKAYISIFSTEPERQRFKLNSYLGELKKFYDASKGTLAKSDTHYLLLRKGTDKIYRLAYKLSEENLIDEKEAQVIFKALNEIDAALKKVEEKKGEGVLKDLSKKLPSKFSNLKVRDNGFKLTDFGQDLPKIDVKALKVKTVHEKPSIQELSHPQKMVKVLEDIRSYAENRRLAKQPGQELAAISDLLTHLPIPSANGDVYQNLSKKDLEKSIKELAQINNLLFEAIYNLKHPPSQFVFHAMLSSLAVCDRLCTLDEKAKYKDFFLMGDKNFSFPWSEITNISEKFHVEGLLDYLKNRQDDCKKTAPVNLKDLRYGLSSPYTYFNCVEPVIPKKENVDGFNLKNNQEYYFQFLNKAKLSKNKYFQPSSEATFGTKETLFLDLPDLVSAVNKLAHITTDEGKILRPSFVALRNQLGYFDEAGFLKTRSLNPSEQNKFKEWDGQTSLIKFEKIEGEKKPKNLMIDAEISPGFNTFNFKKHQRRNEDIFNKYPNQTSEKILLRREAEKATYGNLATSEVKERLIANGALKTRIEDVLSNYMNNSRLMDPALQEDLREVFFSGVKDQCQGTPKEISLFKQLKHPETFTLLNTFFTTQIERYKYQKKHPETAGFLYYLAQQVKEHIQEYCERKGKTYFEDYLNLHPDSIFKKNLRDEIVLYAKKIQTVAGDKKGRDQAKSLGVLLSFANYDLYQKPFEELSEEQIKGIILGQFSGKVAQIPKKYRFNFLDRQLEDSFDLQMPHIQKKMKGSSSFTRKMSEAVAKQFNLEGKIEKNPKFPYVNFGNYRLDFQEGNIYRNGKAISLLPEEAKEEALFGKNFNPICELSLITDPNNPSKQLEVFEFKEKEVTYRCLRNSDERITFQRLEKLKGKEKWFQYYPGFSDKGEGVLAPQAYISKGKLNTIKGKITLFRERVQTKVKYFVERRLPDFLSQLLLKVYDAFQTIIKGKDSTVPSVIQDKSVWLSVDKQGDVLFLDKKLQAALDGKVNRENGLVSLSDLRKGETQGMTLLNFQKAKGNAWDIFSIFCGENNFTVWGKHGKPSIVEIPAYNIKFKFNTSNKCWECLNKEYEGFFVAKNQTLSAKGVLPPTLVLENKQGKKKVLLSGKEIDAKEAPFTKLKGLKNQFRLFLESMVSTLLPKGWYPLRILPRIFSLLKIDPLYRNPLFKDEEMGKLYTFDLSPDGAKMVSDKSKAKQDISSICYLVKYYIYSYQFELASTYMKELISDSAYSEKEVTELRELCDLLGVTASPSVKWGADPQFHALRLFFLNKVGSHHEFEKSVLPWESRMQSQMESYFNYMQGQMIQQNVHYASQSYQFLPNEEKNFLSGLIKSLQKFVEQRKIFQFQNMSFLDTSNNLDLSALVPLLQVTSSLLQKDLKKVEAKLKIQTSSAKKLSKELEKLTKEDQKKKDEKAKEQKFSFFFQWMPDPKIKVIQTDLNEVNSNIEKFSKEKEQLEKQTRQIGVITSRLEKIAVKRSHGALSKRKLQYVPPKEMGQKILNVVKAKEKGLTLSEKALKGFASKNFWKKQKEKRRDIHRDKYVDTFQRYFDLLDDLEIRGCDLPPQLAQLKNGALPRKEQELIAFFESLELLLAKYPEVLNPKLELSISSSLKKHGDALVNYFKGSTESDASIEESSKKVFRPLIPNDRLKQIFAVKDADSKEERDRVGKKLMTTLDDLNQKSQKKGASEELKNHKKPIANIVGKLKKGFKVFNEEEYDYKIAKWKNEGQDHKKVETTIQTALSSNTKWLEKSERDIKQLLETTAPDSEIEAIDNLKKQAVKYQPPSFRELNLMLLKDQLHELSEKNPALKTEHLKRIRQLLFQRAFALRNTQSAQRALANLNLAKTAPSSEKGTFLKAALDEIKAKCHYNPWKQPVFLLMETEANIRLWKKQVDSLIDQISDPTCVRQLIMGSGKSQYILPLIAHLRADGKKLSVLCTTRSLFNSLKTIISHNNRDYFEQGCYVFEWNRYETDELVEKSSHLYTELQQVILNKRYVLTTRESIQSLLATYKLLRHEVAKGGEDQEKKLQAFLDIRKTLELLQEKGVISCDEIDKVLDPKEKTIFTLNDPISFIDDPVLNEQMKATFAVMKVLDSDPRVGLSKNRQNNLLQKERDRAYRKAAGKLIEKDLAKSGKLFGTDKADKDFIVKNKQAFIDYLLGKEDANIEKFVKHSPKKEGIATVRGLFCSLLNSVLKSSNRIRFIRSEDGIHVIPCLKKDVPKEGSQFGHRHEILAYLLMNYKQEGVKGDTIKSLIQKAYIEANRQTDIEKTLPFSETASAKMFKRVFGASLLELDTDQEGIPSKTSVQKVQKILQKDTKRLFRFVENYVLNEPIIYPETIEVDAHEFVRSFKEFGGTSGSVNPDIFPQPINRKGAVDLATNARTLYLMMRNNLREAKHGKSSIVRYEPKTSKQGDDEVNALTTAEEVTHFLKQVTGFDLIVDGGGIIRLSDEEVAKLGGDLGYFMHYFNEKGFLDSKGQPEKPFKVILGKNFSRGADVKLSSKAISLNTISENLTMEELLQEVWRLRQLHKHQVAKLLLTSWLLKHIGATNKTSDEKAHDLIVQYTILQQAIKDADDSLRTMKGAIVESFKAPLEAFAKKLHPKKELLLMNDPLLFKPFHVIENNLSSFTEFSKINQKESPVDQLKRLVKNMKQDFLKRVKEAKYDFPGIEKVADQVLKSIPSDKEIEKMRSVFAEQVIKNASAQQGTDVEVETQTEFQVEMEVENNEFKGINRDHHLKHMYFLDKISNTQLIHNLFNYGKFSTGGGFYFYDCTPSSVTSAGVKGENFEFIVPLDSIHPAFSSYLNYTQNWNPTDRVGSMQVVNSWEQRGGYQTDWKGQEYASVRSNTEDLPKFKPFEHPFQMPIHQIAYIKNLKTGELKVWILDKSDQDQLKTYIASQMKRHNRDFDVAIKDLRTTVTASTCEDISQVVSSDLSCILEVQLKVLAGQLYYSEKEQDILRNWLSIMKEKEVIALHELLFNKVLNYKPEERDRYLDSTLGKILFEYLPQEKKAV